MRGVALFFVLGSVAMIFFGLKWAVLAHVLALDVEPVWRSPTLLGWAVLGLCGAWYHAAPEHAATLLAKTHLALGGAGAMTVLGATVWGSLEPGSRGAEMFEMIGAIMIVAATAILFFNILAARRPAD